MPLTAPAPTYEKRDPIPAGLHAARCYMIADLGVHENIYQGVSNGFQHKIWMSFEIPSQRMEFERDGQQVEGPRVAGFELTLSMGDKANLRKHINTWRGKALTDQEAEFFDILKLVGQPCTLGISHKTSKASGNTYAKIDSINPVMAGVESAPAELPLLVYTQDDTKQFDELPKFIKEKIQAAVKHEQPLPQEVAHSDPGPVFDSTPAGGDTTEFKDDIPW